MVSSYAIKSHFLNSLIWRGHKLTAELFVHNLLFRLKKISKFNQFDMFYYSTLNLRPLISLRPVRVGSVVFRVPSPTSEHRRRLYAIKFILSSAKDSRGSVTLDRIVSLLQAVYFASKNQASDRKFLLYKEALDNLVFVKRQR